MTTRLRPMFAVLAVVATASAFLFAQAEGETAGLKPLDEMSATDKYKGEDGGLYGGGKNVPPEAHQKAAEAELAKIIPLDAEGKPADDGKIGLLSLGMSNTTQEFQAFMSLANRDAAKNSRVVIVDGALGGADAPSWTGRRGDPDRAWNAAAKRLGAAGVSAKQVQAVWIKQAVAGPAAKGEFPKHAEFLRDDLITILNRLKERYPNLRVAYLSSRIYAGYATTRLNPEPYAYESAFAVRWVIRQQIAGDAKLNYDAAKGEAKSPLVLWGPYLWANGTTARKSDELIWQVGDLGPDGTHPSPAGREKVAQLLLNFFKTDPNARSWFLKTNAAAK